MGHALMENRNGLIVGAMTTRASGHAERLAGLALIEPHADRPQPVSPASAPPNSQASRAIRSGLTPIKPAAVGFSAAPRIANPTRVYLQSNTKPAAHNSAIRITPCSSDLARSFITHLRGGAARGLTKVRRGSWGFDKIGTTR